MNIASLAVRYRPIVLSMVLLMVGFGVFSFLTMSRREDPKFTIRVCLISTRWPGASASKVEELITDKVEQQVNGIEEVDEIWSTSIQGQSTVFVELDDRLAPADIPNVWDKVRARVALAPMPEPSVNPVVNDEFGDTSVLLLAVHQVPVHGRNEVREAADVTGKSDRYSLRELEVYAERVQDELRLLPGVARVDLFGVRDEAIYIESDLGNWSQIDLTTESLQRLADERNIIEPGGQISTDSGHYSVKPGGEFDGVTEILRIAGVVQTREGENAVYLSDLGLSVRRGYEDPPTYVCRYGDAQRSTPAVTLGITMKAGSNIIDICQRSKQRIEELIEYEQRLPADIAVVPVSDQSENVAAKIDDVVLNMLEAIAIVVVVVYLLVGFRTSFVMAANIPVVVIATIGVITFFGVELEQISLAALIISLGLLVDNAVQVCDQARSNQIAGMKPVQAAVEGAKTLAIPMLVGTLTTMFAFLPMMFALRGGSKEYVYSLPVTVSVTLGMSWILAMTLCVILAATFIRVPRHAAQSSSPVVRLLQLLGGLFRRSATDNPTASQGSARPSESLVQRIYRWTALPAIRLKWLTLLVTLGFVVAIMSLPVSSEFFPEANRDQFAVKIYLPETATVSQTNSVAKQVEHVIRALSPLKPDDFNPGANKQRLRAMRTMVGGGGARWHLAWDPEPPARNYAEILVRTTDGRLTAQYVEQVREACERGDEQLGIEPIVGARIVPVKLALGPPADPVLLRVIGSGFADPNLLRQYSQQLEAIVRAQPETWNTNSSWGVNGYQVSVDIDSNRATLAGITNSQVARTLNSYYTGLKLTDFREGDHVVPVYFRLRPEQRKSIRGLQESFVEGDRGKVPLAALADFRFSWEPAKIQRRNMNRVIEVSARVETGVSGNDVVDRILNSPEYLQLQSSLPAGFWIETGGAYAESQDAGAQMGLSFLASLFLIIFCLIVQYNGWAKPMVVLSTLPLGLAGAWLGLFLTNNPLGFMPQLGILALFGIVLNTAIIFVEFADILITEQIAGNGGSNKPQKPEVLAGLSREAFRDCLIRAGQQRMLPIFLTTATTIGGLIPLALAGGPLWVGLAWCMIVGLAIATVLTLYAVPAIYAILVESFGIAPVRLESSAEF